MRPLAPRLKLLVGCVLAVAVVAGGVVGMFALWEKEPYYQGKPLSFWLDQFPAILVSTTGPPSVVSSFIRISGECAQSPGRFTDLGPRRADPFPAVLGSPPPTPSLDDLHFFPYLDDFRQSPVIFQHRTPQRADDFAAIIQSLPRAPSLHNWRSAQYSDYRGQAPFMVRDLRALLAVQTLGRQGLPTLLRRMEARTNAMTRWEKQARQWAVQMHLMRPGRVGSLPADVRRGQAVFAILQLGDVAQPIRPDLIRLARYNSNPGVRASALEVLRHLAPDDYASLAGHTNGLDAAGR